MRCHVVTLLVALNKRFLTKIAPNLPPQIEQVVKQKMANHSVASSKVLPSLNTVP
ncbi:hypothetical protein PPEP_b1226 [Pseudoalteromonas peptidolytica F12-50-A1]|uniref:Uncharacterized protein n=1 Tax=Pseudoalteromonas peptidolytica F12-50-A1 TaxID=1315280 RepID=A0A8I0N1M3_9GAMM|nr:hypothetical protein [Pseudoalteromonas peptidolytica F12-50-A1]